MSESIADKHTYSHVENLSDILNDSSIDRVMAFDTRFIIMAWNRTSELATGISKEEALGAKLTELFPRLLDDTEMMEAMYMALQGVKTFLPWAPSFNRQYFENHFIPIRHPNGEIIGVMNIMHDVAHRIKIEKQLQRSNASLEKKFIEVEKANKELSTFTYITTHNIKEPLKHVYTSIELMIQKDGYSLSNHSRGNLRKIQSSLNRMGLLLDDILALSGIGNVIQSRKTIALNDITSTAIDNLKNKISEKEAKIAVSENMPLIEGHKDLLVLLFQNIIDNALKFQHNDNIPSVKISGNLELKAKMNDSILFSEKEYACVSIEDNGLGFSREHSSDIFEMFYKIPCEKTFAGSGIGLAICKKIADIHEGLISVDSEPGQGSIFKLYLPTPAPFVQ